MSTEGWSPNTGPAMWDRCDFGRAHMVNSPGFGRGVLTDCTFVNTRWRGGLEGMSFNATSLRRCRLEGRSMSLEFGLTGPLGERAVPWVEVEIPREQAGYCHVHQIEGPGITLV